MPSFIIDKLNTVHSLLMSFNLSFGKKEPSLIVQSTTHDSVLVTNRQGEHSLDHNESCGGEGTEDIHIDGEEYHHLKQSNSADLPSTQNHQNGDLLSNNEQTESNILRNRFNGLHTKQEEQEHYVFLNQMRVRLGVDSQKLIDLEARITCK